MTKIKQLPLHEAQKIAAGEVVERPANVIKELLENALDAGSTTITIAIDDGGKQRIRITDNGCGMSPDDARLAIMQHATSKITSVDDLPTLTTFGFRGEALSSICAVAQVTLSTQENTAAKGIKLSIEAGAVKEEQPAVPGVGTDIVIDNLFYNVPARRKFLKTKETESRAIVQLFQAFCLVYPHIHAKLYQDSRISHNCPAVATSKERILQLFDRTLYDYIVDGSQTDITQELTVNVLVTNYHYTRYDKNQIFVFVNNRWIKNYKLVNALLKGYANSLPAGKYPAGFIFIAIDPKYIDINMHPRKEEVQFLHPYKIEQAITLAVQQALLQQVKTKSSIEPAYSSSNNNYTKQGIVPDKPETIATGSKTPADVLTTNMLSGKIAFEDRFKEHHATMYMQTAPKASSAPLTFQEVEAIIAPTIEQRAYTLIGYFQKKFIIVEKADGLMLIDAHAAHERILYEKFGTRFNNIPTIELLFPQLILVSRDDLLLLEQHINLFKEHNIGIERFGEQEIRLISLPIHLKHINGKEFIHEVIGWLNEHSRGHTDNFFAQASHKLRATMACKAAIKAGDELTHQQIYQLLDELENTPNQLTCPHGRPTRLLFSTYELEKKFKRQL